MSTIEADEHYPLDLSELPNGWTAVFVGDAVLDVQSGFASGKHNDSGLGIAHLRPMNVDRTGRIDLSVLKYVPAEAGSLRLKSGDVLFNNTNSPELVGKTAPVTRDGVWAFSNHMTRLAVSAEMSPRFIAAQLHFLWMAGYFRHRCTNHVNQASISGSTLARTVPLLVAPLREQQAIAEIIDEHLSDIDAGVATLERALLNLKRYRASVLKSACEGKLVPTEAELARTEGREYEPGAVLLERILKERRERWEAEQLAKMAAKGQVPKDDKWKQKYEEPNGPDTSELAELPAGWAWASLGRLTSLITSGSRGWGDRYADAGPLFVRAQDIKTDRLTLDTVASVDLTGAEEGTRTRLALGDLLVTITGANVTKTAAVAVELEEAYVSQHVGLVRPVFTEYTRYLHAWIVSPAQGRRSLEKAAYGAGKPGLNLDNLRELPVALPPLAEQHRIVAEIERLLSLADETQAAIRAQLAHAEALRRAVLKHAFEGKLVPQDPSDEPASVMLERLRAERHQADARPPRRARSQKEAQEEPAE